MNAEAAIPAWPVMIVLPLGWLVLFGVIAWLWASRREALALLALKKSMVERGMSADEIERVLAAGTKREYAPIADRPPPKPHPAPMDWPVASR